MNWYCPVSYIVTVKVYLKITDYKVNAIGDSTIRMILARYFK